MRIFRHCPRRRVSRESARPSSCNAWRVRGTWLRRRRAPSAMPACVASRPGSATFQNPWRWTRTRSAAVRSTAFRCGPVYLSVRPLILTLSGDGNYREHFIYRRLGCEFIIRCPPGGHCMKVILREDEAAVSEVIGTILILAMTVVLFSSIIIWVSSIPVPTAQTRLDMESSMTPVDNAAGVRREVDGRRSVDLWDRSRERASGLCIIREGHRPGQRLESELGVRDLVDLVRHRECVRPAAEDA